MAMLHMLRERPGIHVITVDHRLREGSADEAAFVARCCSRFGIPHTTVRRGDVEWPNSAAARDGRYAALAAPGRPVVTAHNSDDQAETVRMRARRGGGTLGLSGIPPVATIGGSVRLVRPLLNVSGRVLRGYLTDLGERWVEDPTNAQQSRERIYRRTRPLDIDNAEIARLATVSQRFRSALMLMIADDMRARLSPDRYVTRLNGPPLVHALRHLAAHVGGRAHLPSQQPVETFIRTQTALTIAGCVLRRTKDEFAFSADPRNGAPEPRHFRPASDEPVHAVLAERLR